MNVKHRGKAELRITCDTTKKHSKLCNSRSLMSQLRSRMMDEKRLYYLQMVAFNEPKTYDKQFLVTLEVPST